MKTEYVTENKEKRKELEWLLDAAEGDLRMGYIKAVAGVVVPLAATVGLTTFYHVLFGENSEFYLSTVFTAAVFGWVIRNIYSVARDDIKFASGIIDYSKSELAALEKEE